MANLFRSGSVNVFTGSTANGISGTLEATSGLLLNAIGVLSSALTVTPLITEGDPQPGVIGDAIVLGVLETHGDPQPNALGGYLSSPDYVETEGDPQPNSVSDYVVILALQTEGNPLGNGLYGGIGLGSLETEGDPQVGSIEHGYDALSVVETEGVPVGDGIGGWLADQSTILITEGDPQGNGIYGGVALGPVTTEGDPQGDALLGAIALGLIETKATLPIIYFYNQAADVYITFVLTGSGIKPSIFTGFDFNSFVTVNGNTYGANETGIFLLSGSDDNGKKIHSGVRILGEDLNVNKKKIRKIFMRPDAGSAQVTYVSGNDSVRKVADSKGKVQGTRALSGREIDLRIKDFTELKQMDIFYVFKPR